jgi:hypothetical protein
LASAFGHYTLRRQYPVVGWGSTVAVDFNSGGFVVSSTVAT